MHFSSSGTKIKMKPDDIRTRIQVDSWIELYWQRNIMDICIINTLIFVLQVVKMLIVVLATFIVTWLPSMLMEIIRYNHKAKRPGKCLINLRHTSGVNCCFSFAFLFGCFLCINTTKTDGTTSILTDQHKHLWHWLPPYYHIFIGFLHLHLEKCMGEWTVTVNTLFIENFSSSSYLVNYFIKFLLFVCREYRWSPLEYSGKCHHIVSHTINVH